MSTKPRTVTTGVSIDEALLKVAEELLPNRSSACQQGILDAVKTKLEMFSPAIKKQYTERLAHLIKD